VSLEATEISALDRARRKAYWRLLPLLVLCYIIAYIDRMNVSFAKLTMMKDLPGFDNGVIGFAAGIFFIGYFILEIPGSILVERWSARKWISRILITWGIIAAATAWVKTPHQFYGVRFLLGLAEAGFFPGAIIYMTHWFPRSDRARALGIFMISTPVAQLISPKVCNVFLKIGSDAAHPAILGMQGWQWLYIAWGIPAVVLGVIVLFFLTDHPHEARWLTQDERDALEQQLAIEKAQTKQRHRMTLREALHNPKVLLLTLAYFCTVSCNYGIDFFLPSIWQQWYAMKLDSITSFMLMPPILALIVTLGVGWNSDRTGERRLHAAVPVLIGAVTLALTPLTRGHAWLTLTCFMIVGASIKAYLAPFWALPSIFLTETAAAASVGFINSFGNLGGALGPYTLGSLQKLTGSFVGGLYILAFCLLVFAVIILSLRIGRSGQDEPAEKRAFEVILPPAAEPKPT
jgi:ACS family tartrate transporter-like MFS transporter